MLGEKCGVGGCGLSDGYRCAHEADRSKRRRRVVDVL